MGTKLEMTVIKNATLIKRSTFLSPALYQHKMFGLSGSGRYKGDLRRTFGCNSYKIRSNGTNLGVYVIYVKTENSLKSNSKVDGDVMYSVVKDQRPSTKGERKGRIHRS